LFEYEGTLMKLRYSESFYSLQGEGQFAGVPSVFLRSFGCNFRCMNFGLPRDTPKTKINQQVQDILDDGILDKAKTFDDLPILSTGCDTYASIYPQFKKFMNDKTVDEIADELIGLTPHGSWITPSGQDIHLILTGGEPLLWQKFWLELLRHIKLINVRNITIETNTTQYLKPNFENFLNWAPVKLTWACSPKLSVSGEKFKDAIKPDVAKQYSMIKNSNMYFKFVVEDDRDIEDVIEAEEAYRSLKINAPIYIMPLGGMTTEYHKNKNRIAEIAMERGWRYSPRLQCDLFGNGWRT